MTGKVYSYDYSRDYLPEMPVVEVELSTPGLSGPAITAMALVDSGSDGTMIPIEALR